MRATKGLKRVDEKTWFYRGYVFVATIDMIDRYQNGRGQKPVIYELTERYWSVYRAGTLVYPRIKPLYRGLNLTSCKQFTRTFQVKGNGP